eukprot:2335942-Karenia_brevis.AAC.1
MSRSEPAEVLTARLQFESANSSEQKGAQRNLYRVLRAWRNRLHIARQDAQALNGQRQDRLQRALPEFLQDDLGNVETVRA